MPEAAMDPDFSLYQYPNPTPITHATHYTYNASTPRLMNVFDNPISVFLDNQTQPQTQIQIQPK